MDVFSGAVKTPNTTHSRFSLKVIKFYYFTYFFEIRSCYVAWAGPELLGASSPLASASKVMGLQAGAQILNVKHNDIFGCKLMLLFGNIIFFTLA
jgi:hypothetical protein